MKWGIIENGVVTTISYAPDRDEAGELLPIWQQVPDDVFAGFVQLEGGEFIPPSDGGQPDSVTIVYPVDLWSRMTDDEAHAVEAAMATQPVRIQNIFRAASSYRGDHELWPLLETMAVGLFGAGRAAEILAAS
ncbi:hypothetical protein B5M44_21485 [Shinella sumterensis]|uniref:hypothetical protein n=1 Tax=Shinella sumterensis TaxID=1967501 RepID=UPI00106DD753|nr:hypothetical protein [Shinella sumterensis]MCD1266851.1 hypothetical protein [Shinella sumterensis]TFE95290.1 hypothetical protein B5M44_21485 [Shinella sumterensis]